MDMTCDPKKYAGPPVRALVFDIDGTLLPVGHRGVDPRITERVGGLRAAGICTVIATGRASFVVAPPLMGSFTADYYVCANGAEVLDSGKNRLFAERFSAEEVRLLTAFGEERSLVLSLSFEDGYYIYTGWDRFAAGGPHGGAPAGNSSKETYVNDGSRRSRHLQSAPFGAALFQVPEGLVFPARLGAFQFVRFYPGCFDVYHAGMDKARSVAALLGRLGIPLENTAAFGDGGNDLPMIRAAGTGIAMGNACPELLRAADHVTGSAEEGGILQALDWLGL